MAEVSRTRDATGPGGTHRSTADGQPATGGPGDSGEVRYLSPRVRLFWAAPGVIVTLAGLLIVILVVVAGDPPLLPVAAATVVVGGAGWLLALVVPRARYRRWTFRITEDHLELKRGLVVRRESSVPHFRVQHIDFHQGPLQRLAGVVSVQVSTASAASDAVLPGVEPTEAERVRGLVLARAEADDAV